MIPYGKQHISQADIDAVIGVLKSDFITQGPKVPEFEKAVAKKCHAEFAVATNSATSALHIACLAFDLKKGDMLWTSPISFVASSNCALYCGAAVDFVDIDLKTGNISMPALKEKLVLAEQNNCLPKIIIAVHLAGQSCDMKTLRMLTEQYNIALIEDASHAIGGRYNDVAIGSCQYSDITIFSFHPVKIITSAEGGIALTNQAQLAEKLTLLRSHGIVSDERKMTEPSHGPWYYQQIALGFNYRMTDIQAALGISQLNQLDNFVTQRNKLAKVYDQAFAQTTLSPLTPNEQYYSAYHLYIVLLPEANAERHKRIIEQLRAADICAHVHYIPIHMQPYYQAQGFKQGDFPQAETYYQRAVTLPLYPNLSTKDQQYIIDTLKKLL